MDIYSTDKTENFIIHAKLVHKLLRELEYDYSLVIYIDSTTKVFIICKEHGKFEQRPNNHLRGQGCPKCKESKGENIIRKYLKEQACSFKTQYTFEDCKNINKLPFDFGILHDGKLIGLIEYQGIQHYKSIEYWGGEDRLKYTQNNDLIKSAYCQRNNIPLLTIHYTDKNVIHELIRNFIDGISEYSF